MLSVVIQAGGQSRRMGFNKALVPFLGEPLIGRIVARVRPLADEILLVSNDPEAFAFLGLPVVPDKVPGVGALGGLNTALHFASNPFVAVVACDMPFVNARLLQVAYQRLVTDEADAAIPESSEGLEPFHAVYRKETCLPAVERAIARGDRRMISWLPEVRVAVIPESEVRRYDPGNLAFMNVNTPEDLALALELAQREQDMLSGT